MPYVQHSVELNLPAEKKGKTLNEHQIMRLMSKLGGKLEMPAHIKPQYDPKSQQIRLSGVSLTFNNMKAGIQLVKQL